MDENLKTILDIVEEDSRTRSELEHTISNLRNELGTLHKIISEQNITLQKSQESLIHTPEELPEDYTILKDIILTQRGEINQKDLHNEVLRELIDKFTKELEEARISRIAQFILTDIPGIGLKKELLLNESGIGSINDLMYCIEEELAKNIPGIGVKTLKKWKTFLIKRSEKIRSIKESKGL